jgi:hypothetical protein
MAVRRSAELQLATSPHGGDNRHLQGWLTLEEFPSEGKQAGELLVSPYVRYTYFVPRSAHLHHKRCILTNDIDCYSGTGRKGAL